MQVAQALSMFPRFLSIRDHAGLTIWGLNVTNASGGKPPFPTCEFLSLEWYPPIDFDFFHSFLPWVGFSSRWWPHVDPAFRLR